MHLEVNVLEDWAITLMNQSEGMLVLIGIAVSLAGFVVALRIHSDSRWSLRRVPYFVMLSALFMVASVLPLAWLATYEAMTNGVLWLLTASVFIGIALLGYAYGVIAHARSVNAYGDGSCAWMAFVPIANLVLVFTRPQEAIAGRSAVRMLGNVAGIIFGVFLIALGQGITKAGDSMLENMLNHAESDPAIQSMSVAGMVQAQGLETTLAQMAAEVPSEQIDDVTTLQRVEATGTKMRYIYEVSVYVESLPLSMRTGLTEHNCTYHAMRPIIEAGATLEHAFRRRDGSEIGTVTVTREACAF